MASSLTPPGKEAFLDEVLEAVNTESSSGPKERSDHRMGRVYLPGLEAFRVGVGSGCIGVHPLQLWQIRGG